MGESISRQEAIDMISKAIDEEARELEERISGKKKKDIIFKIAVEEIMLEKIKERLLEKGEEEVFKKIKGLARQEFDIEAIVNRRD